MTSSQSARPSPPPNMSSTSTVVFTGANFHVQQEFCQTHGLSLSKYGPAVVWQHEWYQVFRFGRSEDADRFMKEFGGDRMHPSEKGKGMNWAQWRKGSHRP
jgi:hypothetical protein